MCDLKLLSSILFGLILCSIEIKSEQKVKVMLSQSKSIIENEIGNQGIQRLDFEIIEKFAKKFKLKIEFIITNETLNEIFSDECFFQEFSQSDAFSSVPRGFPQKF